MSSCGYIKVRLLFPAILFTIFSLATIVSFCSFATAQRFQYNSRSSIDPSDFSVYENLTLGIRLEYPSIWNVKQGNENEIKFSPPSENKTELSIVNFDTPFESSLIDVVRESLLKYKNNSLNFAIVGNKTVFTNDNRFLIINYSYADKNNHFNVTDVWTEKDAKIYLMTYKSDSDIIYSKYWPIIQKMIDSFKFINFLKYVKFDLGIEIDYPSIWAPSLENGTEGKSLSFYPLQKFGFGSGTVVDISNSHNNENRNLSEIVNQRINDYRGEGYYGYPHFHLAGSNSTNLLGPTIPRSSQHMLNYSYLDRDSRIIKNNTEIMTIQNGKVYSILYSAQEKDYSKYLPTAIKMIRSIHIFDILRYEKVFNNNSGVILRYPNQFPWKQTPNQISNNKVNLMYGKYRNLTLSVFPYKKDLESLGQELINNISKQTKSGLISPSSVYSDFRYNTNRTSINSNLGNPINATMMTFSFSKIKGLQISAIANNNTAYVINFTADSYNYNRYLPTIEEVINSIKVVDYIPQDSYNNSSLSALGISLEYPRGWKNSTENVEFTIYSNNSGGLDVGSNGTTDFSGVISASAAGNNPMETDVGVNINTFKGNLTDYQLIELVKDSIAGHAAYKETSTYRPDPFSDERFKRIAFYMTIGKNFFTITFTTELDKFLSYLPTMQHIRESINFTKKDSGYIKETPSGVRMPGPPVDLSINPTTNKLYVAIPSVGQLYVINGSTDKTLSNITLGGYPNAIAIDSLTNTVYVTSPENDVLYVIDGFADKLVAQIQLGRLIADMAIDTNEFGGFGSIVFVANSGSNKISVIDGATNRLVENITTLAPYGIGINRIANRLYVTDQSNGVSVIDYYTSVNHTLNAKLVKTIKVGLFPIGVVTDPSHNRIYVANSGEDKISVIDGNTNNVVRNITVGPFPYSLDYNPTSSTIYVATSGNNTISSIKLDEQNLKERRLPDIVLDSVPNDVVINPKTNLIYSANFESNSTSVINGNTNQVTSVLTFDVFPSYSGRIECNKIKQPVNTSLRIDNNSQCQAIANQGFNFNYWSNSSNPNIDILSSLRNLIFSSFNPTKPTFKVNQSGIYTANFVSLPLIIQEASSFISIAGLFTVVLLASAKPIVNRVRKNITRISKSGVLSRDEAEEKAEAKGNVEKGDIITIDATVIIGVLIFLSFSEGFDPSEKTQIDIITASIVFPFAISAIVAAVKSREFATNLMIAGFVNLMISVILIGIMSL